MRNLKCISYWFIQRGAGSGNCLETYQTNTLQSDLKLQRGEASLSVIHWIGNEL